MLYSMLLYFIVYCCCCVLRNSINKGQEEEIIEGIRQFLVIIGLQRTLNFAKRENLLNLMGLSFYCWFFRQNLK